VTGETILLVRKTFNSGSVFNVFGLVVEIFELLRDNAMLLAGALVNLKLSPCSLGIILHALGSRTEFGDGLVEQ
jgi:hypothetical protein